MAIWFWATTPQHHIPETAAGLRNKTDRTFRRKIGPLEGWTMEGETAPMHGGRFRYFVGFSPNNFVPVPAPDSLSWSAFSLLSTLETEFCGTDSGGFARAPTYRVWHVSTRTGM